ncbi:50S ribosomal protein L39e [Candidatus Micrarchaeota archaeon]|nr:50S ribosomal protein L39e [Candidatus Micrarchaeota archaeon]
MSKKGLTKKMRLAKEKRKIRRIPAFVMLRTKRKVTQNKRNRNWRTDKLRIED